MSQEINKTYLSIDKATERGIIHRDMIAHCFRWSHVVKYLLEKHRYKTADILDIGCGRELPLLKLMYTNKMTPYRYVGVDAGPIPKTEMIQKIEAKMEGRTFLYPDVDFSVCDLTADYKANVVVCFEVLEHVYPGRVLKIFNKICNHLADDGAAFFSTPCYNEQVGAAANHLNEMKYEVMGLLLNRLFYIDNMWGTFASQRDIVPVMNHFQRQVFEELKDYYDSNVLSVIFAPMLPAYSRNVLWQVSFKHDGERGHIFPEHLEDIPRPWSSAPQSEWEKVLECLA